MQESYIYNYYTESMKVVSLQ